MGNSLVMDDPNHARFDLMVDDTLVGILAYEVVPSTDCVILQHTVVKEAFGDRGWAAVLIRGALDIVRTGNLTVWPACTYVRAFIASNIDYLDLVADQDPAMSASCTTTGA
ncbi:MAG: GNAT family N-acetyltransferase [Rhodococcus sp. (in: high G+C Gram-positive bacteria)]